MAETEKYFTKAVTTWVVVCRQTNGTEIDYEVAASKEAAEATVASKNAETERMERAATMFDSRGDRKRGR